MSGDDRREGILAAAAPLFAAEGFAGTSTRAIAAAAGVNVATLAYHFGDKQGLYDALVDRTYARLLAAPVAGAPPGADTEAALRALVAEAYRFACAHRVELQVLLRHVLDTRRLPEAVSSRWIGPLLSRVGELLAPLGIPLDGPRVLALLSLNHLVVRYAITEPGDLASLGVGAGGTDAVAAHLGDVAVRLLGVGT